MKTPSTAPTATFGLEPAGYRDLLQHLARSTHVLVYSGSGLSAGSGLPTYRGVGEHLWTDDVLERVSTFKGYLENREYAVDWYIEQSRRIQAARPHNGHRALSNLEQQLGVTHVTQNVDTLLEMAGCSNVVHLHGRYDWLKCLYCDWQSPSANPEALRQTCPECGSGVRPAITWMGEAPEKLALLDAETGAELADVVLVIGTPAEMYPGAAIVEMANLRGAPVCVINPEWCENLHFARWQLFGTAQDVLPTLVQDLEALRRQEGHKLPWFLRWLPHWLH